MVRVAATTHYDARARFANVRIKNSHARGKEGGDNGLRFQAQAHTPTTISIYDARDGSIRKRTRAV